ncbi:MAG TPA: FAD-binding oxidoreductase [Actinophytocola sp.]|uniref:FAD-binding oxidoreductase n=1 Tax=Actinophytocola sp. TaxID=1872138 RepID=UPI002DDD8D25|nr:FAD-binding oxidoreductase [Actinophytocola sp.]HEV2781092.1 FAD-binding oxidoreductase [Actinophytocola sp.]
MTVPRRGFLLGVAAATSACTGRSPAGPPATSAPPSSTAVSRPPDWAALRARLPGGLVLPGEPGYDSARRSFNPLFDGQAPAAVATCTRPEDVQACVEEARAARIPIAARSGGHGYAGYSTPPSGLVVDLAGLSGVRVHADGTAEIGAGTRLIDVYAELARAGRCLPAGSCPTVGIAGLTLGGGIGVLARKFGLTCDRLRSARVVTADATLRTAAADSEPDLFWALRGGGGGNLGIVTSFTFTTEPAPDLTVFALRFPPGAAADVLGAWQRWITDAPDELWSMCAVSAGRPPSVRVGGCFVGPPSAVAPLLAKLPDPTARTVLPKGFLDAMRYFAGCSEHTVARCQLDSAGGALDRAAFVASSRVLPGQVDPAHLVSIMDGRTAMDLLLDSFGGAVSRVAPDATAFPHRGALASAQIYASATPASRDRVARAVAEVRDALGRLTGPAAYVNYIDSSLPDWATAYYGANLPRLRQIARHFDPDAVFAFAQGLTNV